MKKYFSLVTVSLMALAMVCTMPLKAFAASTDQATEQIDTAKTSTLTVAYNADDTEFESVKVQLYRVADLTAEYDFVLTEEFAASGLDLNNLDSSDQWRTVSDTLDAFVQSNSPASVGEFTLAPSNTKAVFNGLTPGWYFIPQVVLVCENDIRTFSSVIATLPTVSEGKWVYSYDTKPKSENVVPTYKDVTYFINVVWEDAGYEKYRPASVVAHVSHTGGPDDPVASDVRMTDKTVVSVSPKALSYGVAALTSLVTKLSTVDEAPATEVPSDVTITPAMNWHYEWTTKDDGTVWNVTADDVEHYKKTIDAVDHGWVITYHIDPPPAPVPKTGEAFPLLPIVLLFVSGGILVVFGVVLRRRANG